MTTTTLGTDSGRPARKGGAILALGAPLFVILALACGKSDPVVLQVGNEHIRAGQARIFMETGPSGESVEQRLVRLADREVVALTLPVPQAGSELDRTLRQTRDDIVIRCYLEKAHPKSFEISEESLWAQWSAQGERRRIRHILARDEAGAMAARRRLTSGESFDVVCAEVSQDQGSKERGGDIGFQTKASLDPAFASAAFSLPVGRLSEPTKSAYGYHLVEVLEIRQPDRASFDAVKASILGKRKEEVSKALLHMVVQENKGKFSAVKHTERLGDDTPEGAPRQTSPGEVVAELGGEKVTIGDLDAFLAQFFSGQTQGHALGPQVKEQFLDLLLEEKIALAVAKESGIEKDPRFKARLWNEEQQIRFNMATRDYLAAYRPSEKELRSHFEASPARFAANPERRLAILLQNDPALLDSLAKKAQAAPRTFQALVRAHSIDAETAASGGDIGWVDQKSLSNLLDEKALHAVLKASAGSVLGPFPTPAGGTLIGVLDAREGTPLRFEEVRDKVAKDFVMSQRDAILSAWVGTLRKKVRVTAYPERYTPDR